MAEINSIQLPSGTSYNLTDGIHMPSEATTVAEMVANATGAGDTGIAVFGLSASLTNTICGTSASSICVTKYSSTDSRVDFTIQMPSVLNRYYANSTSGTLVTGSVDASTKAVTIRYTNWDDRPLYFTGVTVSVATNSTIMTISDSSIYASSIVTGITFTNPEYITSDVTWTSADGSITFIGTCTTATTANVIVELANLK